MDQLSLDFSERAPQAPRIYKVSEISRELRERLERAYDAVWVSGEVSNLRVQASGHAYFTLKDDKAQISCVFFRGARSRLQFKLADGQALNALGQITYYDRGGRLQMVLKQAEIAGHGALQQAFEELARRLREAGLTAPERKKPIPRFPRAIGVVTSLTAAALRDILRTLKRRVPSIPIIISPTEVQGERAAPRIQDAIARLDQSGLVDVILVARGGGSLEDLWCFNEEIIAKAILSAQTPIITGVGHETDTTIADLVSDLRASTPTAAAESAATAQNEILERLDGLSRRIDKQLSQRLNQGRLRLLAADRGLAMSANLLNPHRQRLDEAQFQLLEHTERRLQATRTRLDALSRRLLRAAPASQISRRKTRLIEAQAQLKAALSDAIHQRSLQHARLTDRLHAQKKDLTATRQALLARLSGRLDALSPLAVLGRGYAIAEHADGRVVYDAEAVELGETLRLRLARGELWVKPSEALAWRGDLGGRSERACEFQTWVDAPGGLRISRD